MIIDWSMVVQVIAFMGTVMFYSGRFLARFESLEGSMLRIEGRVDELARRTVGQTSVLVAPASATRPDRGGSSPVEQEEKSA